MSTSGAPTSASCSRATSTRCAPRGGVDISYDDAWAAHRLHASYTVVATFLAYMPSYAASDGVGLGDALLARSDAALADLDVVDAVRAALP